MVAYELRHQGESRPPWLSQAVAGRIRAAGGETGE